MSTCRICGKEQELFSFLNKDGICFDCEVADTRLRIYREFFVGLNKRLDEADFVVFYKKKDLDIETQEWYVGFWADSLEDTTTQIDHCVEAVFTKISQECTAKRVLIEDICLDITRHLFEGSHYINIGVKWGGE